ncbi:SHOCT domain-containing protein [Flavobacteriaceae bacterium S0862]|jgi:putative membrane protein|nr:SHOCT domain-containing protein [Flavobacteriaceae bacterium S0862]
MYHCDGHFFGMHFLWWIVWLFVLIGIFWFLYKTSFRGPQKEDSLQILKKRFANGKISKEEYEESKKILEEDL